MAASKTPKGLFLPELLEPEPAPWSVNEVAIRDAKVNLTKRVAWVPRAATPAQVLARLHELGHVKYTPRDWNKQMAAALGEADEGAELDINVVKDISKMLEENRIDWILWDRHQIDLRPAREVLDWTKMPVPKEPLGALQWVLQLAWTVWASRGLSNKIPNIPPDRPTDPATGEFFDACWAVLADHHHDLCVAIVRGCMAMYVEPTHQRRNSVAIELASFFPPKAKEPEQPPLKPEEQAAQHEAEQEEREKEIQQEEEETGGVGDVENLGYYDIHDHTASIRRPSMRIRRREAPVYAGIKLSFPQRYMLDKAVFARRLLTEGGIMIDGSGSMSWDNDNLQDVLGKLPAVTVGIYGGYNHPGTIAYYRRYTGGSDPEGGRICILAKLGRFSKFNGLEPGFNSGNSVDVEALQLLARWPRPRLWLSDGLVCGGKWMGSHPVTSFNTTDAMLRNGRVVDECAKLMRANEIYRVHDVETLMQLLAKKRVTLYRSPVNHEDSRSTTGMGPYDWYPASMLEQPVTFQL